MPNGQAGLDPSYQSTRQSQKTRDHIPLRGPLTSPHTGHCTISVYLFLKGQIPRYLTENEPGQEIKCAHLRGINTRYCTRHAGQQRSLCVATASRRPFLSAPCAHKPRGGWRSRCGSWGAAGCVSLLLVKVHCTRAQRGKSAHTVSPHIMHAGWDITPRKDRRHVNFFFSCLAAWKFLQAADSEWTHPQLSNTAQTTDTCRMNWSPFSLSGEVFFFCSI